MEGFLLFAGTDFFIVIINPSVCARLPSIVSRSGAIEQFVIDLLDRLVTIIHVEVGTLPVYVFSLELATVVVDRSFPDPGADRSFHFL